MDGCKAASKLRESLCVGEVPVDIEEVCRALGYDLRFMDLDKEDGLFVKAGGTVVIVVNDVNRTWERQRFTIAHEIGHAVLGHGSVSFDRQTRAKCDPNEWDANAFAAELLMPSTEVCRLFREGITSSDDLASLFQVSVQAMEIRLNLLRRTLVSKVTI